MRPIPGLAWRKHRGFGQETYCFIAPVTFQRVQAILKTIFGPGRICYRGGLLRTTGLLGRSDLLFAGCNWLRGTLGIVIRTPRLIAQSLISVGNAGEG